MNSRLLAKSNNHAILDSTSLEKKELGTMIICVECSPLAH
jgi:hypothetical protein